jgi:ornithine cyclodeaminase
MDSCVDLMAKVLTESSRENVVLPLRSLIWLPDQSGLLGLMPGYLGEPACLGIKVITFMPGRRVPGLDSHQGVVMLFDPESGSPLAIMDASSITEIRTAAASGAATRVLAREDAGDLAVIGTGVQARSHLGAMSAVRDLSSVRVCGRTVEQANRFARENSAMVHVPISVCETGEEAVEGADLICTATSSRVPVLEGEWIAPGAHINAAGACFKTSRELDAEAVAISRLFTDRRESAENEAGDYLMAVDEGVIGKDHLLGEVGDVLLGGIPGRESADDITLFESLGIAVEDLAAAHYLLKRATEQGVGTDFELSRSGHV